MVTVAWYLVESSIQVAWLAIKPGPPPMTAVLRARLAVKSDLVLALAVHALNLIPGTIVLEIDRERRMLYVHVLDVGSTSPSIGSIARSPKWRDFWWRPSSVTPIGG